MPVVDLAWHHVAINPLANFPLSELLYVVAAVAMVTSKTAHRLALVSRLVPGGGGGYGSRCDEKGKVVGGHL